MIKICLLRVCMMHACTYGTVNKNFAPCREALALQSACELMKRVVKLLQTYRVVAP